MPLVDEWHVRAPRRTADRLVRALTRVVAVAAALVTLLPALARAQTATGNLRGYVRGADGAGVPQAQVVARALETNARRVTTTNASGFYYLGGLRPGRYEVTVRRVGLAPAAREATIGIGLTVDLDLSTSDVTTTLATVRVRDRASSSRTSEVGTNITRAQVDNLPNFERNVLDLARLVPGVTLPDVNSTDKTFRAGGQPAEQVNVFVDGASFKNDILRGGVSGQDASKGNPFPQAAIQEFRVITQNYKAEYQRASSAVIVASTRTGTNVWEADFFGYGIGRSWTSTDAFSRGLNVPRPDASRLQAGGSIAGPLVKDKLFLFATYELNSRNDPVNVLLGGDSARAPASLVNSLRPLTGPATQEFRSHLGLGKLTWIADERNTVDASVNIRRDDDFRGFQGQTSAQSAENLRINTYTGIATWKRAGDTWLNELQGNWQLAQWNPTPRNADVVGRNYFGILRTGGASTEQDFSQQRFSIRNDITRAAFQFGGEHVVKFGGNVDLLRYRVEKNFLANPEFRFRSDEQWSRPFEAGFGFGNPRMEANNTQFGLYIQDDWSVTKKLVLNLGIRWDAETNMANNSYVTPRALADSLTGPLLGRLTVGQPLAAGGSQRVDVLAPLGGIENFITTGRGDRPMFMRAFQPRVGASYDVFGDGRTVVFGGAGLYFDRTFWNSFLDEQFRRQFAVLNVAFRDACGPGAPPNCAVWNERFFDPAQLRTLAGTAGLPEVFLVKNDLRPPSTVQSSLGVRQEIGRNRISLAYVGIRGRNFTNFIRASDFGGLGPNYSTAFVTDDRVKTFYDALQVQIERPFTAETRFGGSIAWTLSRSREQGQSNDLFWGFDDRFPTVADRPIRRTPGDQRHVIVANGIVQLPWKIRLASIVTLGTGITQNATDATNGFGAFQQRTYVYTPPSVPFLGMGRVFAQQNMDLRVDRPFTVGRGNAVSLTLDLFNVFNNANFGCWNATIPPTGQTNADFGRPFCAAPGRRIQVGLRYGFQGAGATGVTSR